MKIVLVSRCAWTLYNFRNGQMRALKSGGHEVIGAGAGGDGFESKVEALGVPFVPLPVDKKGLSPRHDLQLLWTLYRRYRREKPDIVHHFTIKPVIYGSLAARLARVPRIVNTITGLGFVFMEGSAAWLRRTVESQYRLSLACAHYTFFQNPEDRQLFLNRGLVRPEKSGLLPGSGVDVSFFAPPNIENDPPTEKPFCFLMVARLLQDKGVYEYVEAARRVKAACPETRFLLLGARDERNPTVVSQVEIDRWQAESTVQWLGEVSDVRAVIAEADAVVLPSYREGTPRALLEAAAMAKPLIATDAVGCREVVEDGVNGLLVPVKDAGALAAAMRCLMADRALCGRMGAAGREKVVREFDEAIVIERVVEIYHKEKL